MMYNVQGANQAGWTSVLVRTGVFQSKDDNQKYLKRYHQHRPHLHSHLQQDASIDEADIICDSVDEAVAWILENEKVQ